VSEDIQYTDADGKPIAVEVKNTTPARFSTIEITANEWASAQEKGSGYVLALVVNAQASNLRIALLRDHSAITLRGGLLPSRSHIG